ncbi:hypothetical protein [Streptomyces sp. CC228A]|uniref:hypothetical protein n=1 Tax=Streptomyces sp. CC228A TaxID=2898186 RepID=UPI001F3A66C4|nr:hypothetical protein [Streptomyces sp. CC228A]
MSSGMSNEPDSDLQEWGREAHLNVLNLASMLGVEPDRYTSDPLVLMPGLQNYTDRLPLGEFEQSDWITLHTDLTAYLGDVLALRHGAAWIKVVDRQSPTGYRFFVQAEGLDGAVHMVEPFDVVMEEFQNLPIEIARMIANAEAVLRVSPSFNT